MLCPFCGSIHVSMCVHVSSSCVLAEHIHVPPYCTSSPQFVISLMETCLLLEERVWQVARTPHLKCYNFMYSFIHSFTDSPSRSTCCPKRVVFVSGDFPHMRSCRRPVYAFLGKQDSISVHQWHVVTSGIDYDCHIQSWACRYEMKE